MVTKAETRRERRTWASVRRAEKQYGSDLRKIARQIAALLDLWTEDEPPSLIIQALEAYSEIVRPWAETAAARMLADVSRRDQAMFNLLSRSMSRNLADELKHAPTGDLYANLMNLQVELITSLPLKAAQQVHEIVTGARAVTAERAETLAEQIKKLGDITVARANLIARTEVARSAANLVQSRAQFVGSEGYIWHSSGDGAVRPRHAALNKTYHRWDTPPACEEQHGKPVYAHPGCVWNCRCFAEPVIPDKL